jgi:hypothetical protein
MEYVYHMRDPKGALVFLQAVHRELMDISRSGIILALSSGSPLLFAAWAIT